MENVFKDFRDMYKNLALTLMANCVKFSQNVSNIREEEQRKLKSNEDLAKRIAEMEAQLDSIAVEESKVKEEKKKILQKNAELQAKLKQETIKADDLQLVAGREKAKMEEEEQLSKNIQDKVNVHLKPYHDILGLTFQRSIDPEDNLRFIFKMPNGKKCVIKITKNGLKIIKCVPMLKDLDKLEAHLAKTNDFPGFVVTLRTMFMEQYNNKC